MSPESSRAADRAYIADIDAKVLALKLSIQILEADKTRAQERLNSYTYPVLTLPNEIVSEIFIHFLPAYPYPSPLVGRLSPTVLTHVCRQWKEISLATPALWQAISYPRHLGDHQGQLLQILKSWLDRSGDLPLSFFMEPFKFSESALSDECLAALILHRQRWEYVTLAVASEADVQFIPGTMPLLRQIEIEAWANMNSTPSPIRFDQVPRLRSITFWKIYCAPDDIFPWSQLTSLTLMCEPAECSEVL
ncbi:F-box domain-containing protein [Mycena sanguinolenta]|uniref:F-box domain-containing protein n=1 Tax=Mycena sanguinolenta TaxID=230812 RepID=A0A8H6ZLP5_9AGAR|nr:F-box domain-containing protein [Mycena sanguinolenta]